MTTPVWTLTTMQYAQAKHQFVFVGGTANEVTIADAQRLWQANPNILFQTGYRIAGTEGDIRAALSAAGVSPQDIDATINSSITSDNYTSEAVFPIFSEEVNTFNAWRRGAVQANVNAGGVKLFDMMATVDPTLTEGIRSQKQATAMGLTTPLATKTTQRKTKPLTDKISNLPAGKVLDVSKITPNGAKVVAIPKPSDRSRKYGSQGLPIVSDNLESYLLALSMLPGGETAYAQHAAIVRQQFEQKSPGAIARSPATILPTPLPPQPYTNPFAGLEAYVAPPPEADLILQPTYPIFTKTERRKREAAKKAGAALAPFPGTLPAAPYAGQPLPLAALSGAGQPLPLTTFPGAGQPLLTPFQDDSDSDDSDDSDLDEDIDSDDEDNPVMTPFPGTLPPLPTITTGASMVPLPGALPSMPLPGALPTVQLPGALPTVQLPGALPSMPLPGALPTVQLPGALPSMPLPGALPTVQLPGALPTMPLPGTLPTVVPPAVSGILSGIPVATSPGTLPLNLPPIAQSPMTGLLPQSPGLPTVARSPMAGLLPPVAQSPTLPPLPAVARSPTLPVVAQSPTLPPLPAMARSPTLPVAAQSPTLPPLPTLL